MITDPRAGRMDVRPAHCLCHRPMTEDHTSRWSHPPDITWPLPKLLLDTADRLDQYGRHLYSCFIDYPTALEPLSPDPILFNEELDHARILIPMFFADALLRCAVDERPALKASLITMQEDLLRQCHQTTDATSLIQIDLLLNALALAAGTLRKLTEAVSTNERPAAIPSQAQPANAQPAAVPPQAQPANEQPAAVPPQAQPATWELPWDPDNTSYIPASHAILKYTNGMLSASQISKLRGKIPVHFMRSPGRGCRFHAEEFCLWALRKYPRANLSDEDRQIVADEAIAEREACQRTFRRPPSHPE